MIMSLKELIGYSVHGVETEIGPVLDLYYDDEAWLVRYIALDTGDWLDGRRILLSTVVIDRIEPETHRIVVNLTRERVSESPPLEGEGPPTRDNQHDLHSYYDWPEYWEPNESTPSVTPDLASVPLIEMAADVEESIQAIKDGNRSDLRSLKETIGFVHVQGLDGDIGHVDDLIVDESWQVQYIMIDTSFWEAGKRALLSPNWVDRLGWSAGNLYVNINQDTVRNSPEFPPGQPLDRGSLDRLYDYYTGQRGED